MRIQDLLYSTLNPPMRALLRSPFHAIASRNLALLRYRGRKSGREFATPLSYVREGNLVRFLSSRNTRWWLNFKDGPTAVEVEIARKVYSGKARLLTSEIEDGEPLRRGVRAFLGALPRDAVVYGIGLDEHRKPREADIQSKSDHVILVEVEIDEAE